MQIVIKYFQLQDLLFFSKNKSGRGLEPLSIKCGFYCLILKYTYFNNLINKYVL